MTTIPLAPLTSAFKPPFDALQPISRFDSFLSLKEKTLLRPGQKLAEASDLGVEPVKVAGGGEGALSSPVQLPPQVVEQPGPAAPTLEEVRRELTSSLSSFRKRKADPAFVSRVAADLGLEKAAPEKRKKIRTLMEEISGDPDKPSSGQDAGALLN